MATPTKLRILCLHGFRTSAEILKMQFVLAHWTKHLSDILELVFIDAPNPCTGRSDVEAYFDPPYYEWWNASADYKVYTGFHKSISFVSDYLSMHGPFHGLMGFSQGATLSSSLLSMQQKGQVAGHEGMPPVNFLVVVGGGTPRADDLQTVFTEPVKLPSIHLIGDRDFLRRRGEMLQAKFVDPVVIRHPNGHVVPKLDENSMKQFREFLEEQQLKLTCSV